MAWTVEIGEELPRRAVHDLYGGSWQGGMTTTSATDDLLLFSSGSGLRYGYDFDGWRSDSAYHYTGEGQVGDQQFVRNNASLRDHVARGLRPRLFEEAKRSMVRYLGEFRLADDPPFYPAEAQDREGDLRKVIVFRLLPVDAEPPIELVIGQEWPTVSVRDVPLEAYEAETFQSNPRREPTMAERREAALVGRYGQWLMSTGGPACRKEITYRQAGRALYTDLYDSGRSELVEAKSSASRYHVRLAIGQVLDYARYVDHKALAVLLPSDPGEDLTDLLHRTGITCLYEDENGDFVRRDPSI